MSKRELKALNKLAMKLIGIPYAMLIREDQEFICSEAAARRFF